MTAVRNGFQQYQSEGASLKRCGFQTPVISSVIQVDLLGAGKDARVNERRKESVRGRDGMWDRREFMNFSSPRHVAEQHYVKAATWRMENRETQVLIAISN
jgi:hypothetical protein